MERKVHTIDKEGSCESPFLTSADSSGSIFLQFLLLILVNKFNKMVFKVCGPKLSLCGLVLSVWGIIQLVSKPCELGLVMGWNFPGYYIAVNYFQTLMGVFYYIRALALLEDLPLKEEHHSIPDFITDVETGYGQVSQVVSTLLLLLLQKTHTLLNTI